MVPFVLYDLQGVGEGRERERGPRWGGSKEKRSKNATRKLKVSSPTMKTLKERKE